MTAGLPQNKDKLPFSHRAEKGLLFFEEVIQLDNEVFNGVGKHPLIVENNPTVVELLKKLDSDVFFHCVRTRQLAINLGIQMSLTSAEMETVAMGALLHDVGKERISEGILNKVDPLTPREWEQLKMHPTFGYDLLQEAGLCEQISEIVLEHHRWITGSGGYPEKALRKEPALLTRVVTVADVFDAMTSERPYRRAFTRSACLAYIEENVGSQFDQDIVNVLKSLV